MVKERGLENEQMLKEFNQHNRRDHIHYNENEKIIFQEILNDVIQHKYKKQSRAVRSKMQRIKIVGIANKLLKRRITPSQKIFTFSMKGIHKQH